MSGMKTALAAALLAVQLLPTDGSGERYKVTTDKPPTSHVGRVPALPSGATIAVSADHSKKFETSLVGPSGVLSWSQKGTWSRTITEPGGYKLSYGGDCDSMHYQLDFVVNEPAADATTDTSP